MNTAAGDSRPPDWVAADGTAAARRLLPIGSKFQLGKELLFLLELGEFRFPVLALSGVLGGERSGAVFERDGLDAGGGEHVDVVEHRPEPRGVPSGDEGNGERGMGNGRRSAINAGLGCGRDGARPSQIWMR